MDEEKSYKPSKKRLDKARKEGKTLKSQLITQVLVLVSAFTCMVILVPQTWVGFRLLLECISADPFVDPRAMLLLSGQLAIRIIAMILCVGSLAALLGDTAQVGIRIETAPLAPRLSRMNPVLGLKRMATTFPKQFLVLSLRTLILGAILYYAFTDLFFDALYALNLNGNHRLAPLESGIYWVGGLSICGFAMLATADYLFRRRLYFKELSMSHREVREEFKNDEGDPMIKAMRRSMHEALAMQDLVKRVRRSKVIVVEKNS